MYNNIILSLLFDDIVTSQDYSVQSLRTTRGMEHNLNSGKGGGSYVTALTPFTYMGISELHTLTGEIRVVSPLTMTAETPPLLGNPVMTSSEQGKL